MMDTRVRMASHTMKTTTSSRLQQHGKVTMVKEKEKTEFLPSKIPMDTGKGSGTATAKSRRERKIALQQDIDKLRKKLQQEENVHRALERAFTRPLGALPRLPPYLPQETLELLAEVAVLEEEVVRLEEQVVNFRQDLYQEAIHMSASKKEIHNETDLYPCSSSKRTEQSKASSSSSSTTTTSGCTTTSDTPSDTNDITPNRIANEKRQPLEKEKPTSSSSVPRNPTVIRRPTGLMQVDKSIPLNRERIESNVTVNDMGLSPNRISEDIVRSLMEIFGVMSSPMSKQSESTMAGPSISGSDQDPYRIFPVFGRRDIGPYKKFLLVDEFSINPNIETVSPLLIRKLKLLLGKLAVVDLQCLKHQQQKLAFWINVYNSCMMNAYLENGFPSSPHMVVALMQKAIINVGGHLLSAMTIEHFILRLSYHPAYTKGTKNGEMTTRSILGLDWPEPLVTFALSCGSWSSPAVRMYTASQVDNELETAKRDYLQAAIGISATRKLGIPKLLSWYMFDFAKEVESLMDWICLQLPSGLRNDAVRCIERARRSASTSTSTSTAQSQTVQILPYHFRFRYILAT